MEIPSFALVHVPGETLDRMHLFFGPETLPATSIDSLSQPRTLPQFFLSPWNTSESIFVFDDFKGVLNLGEAFLWIEDIQMRSLGTADTSFGHFESSVQKAKAAIDAGDLEKVVLAREKFIKTDTDLTELGTLFYSLCKEHPQAFVYVCSSKNWGTWMGASPETLVNHKEGMASIMSLAGTLFSDSENWSAKESAEQEVTSNFIKDCLQWSEMDQVDVQELRQGKMRHLMSVYRKAWALDALSDLIKRLSPTPAVCGSPKEKALDYINDLELFSRDLYAGFMGIHSGEGLITNVNLRCAEIGDGMMRLIAGCGINKDSDPKREWDETALKMSVIEEYLS